MKRKTAICGVAFVLGVFLGLKVSEIYIFAAVSTVMILAFIDVLYTKRKDGIAFMAAALCLLIGFTYMNVFTAHKEREVLPFCNQTLPVVGEIYEITEKENNTTVILKTHAIGDQNVNLSLLTRIYSECPELQIGQVVELNVTLYEPSGLYNDGTFYYPNYLKSQGYFLTGSVDGSEVKITGNAGNSIRYLPAKIRAFLRTGAEKYLSEHNADLLVGIMLGETEQIAEETKIAFQKSGISHLTAVSGLHVGIILSFAMFLFRKIGNKRIFARVIYIVLIVAVIIITGASPSVVRAGIMIIFTQVAWILKRDADGITSLSIAAAVILFGNPYGIYDVGFGLSFLATLGILLFAPKLIQISGGNRIKNKVGKFFRNAAIISIAAQICTLPVIINTFHHVPILAVITNILVAPIVPFVLGSGILFLIMEAMFAPLAIPIAFLCNMALSVLSFIASKIAVIPFATMPCPRLSTVLLLSYIAFLVFILLLFYKRERFYPEIALGVAVIFIITSIVFQVADRNTVTVSYINVGQGSSTLIQTGENRSILIDGGGSRTSNIGEYVLDDFLYNRGILKVSVAVVTHFDIDHSDGIRTMIEKGRVRELVVPDIDDPAGEELLRIAKEKGVPVTKISKGEQIYFDETLYLDCLSPAENENSENDNNGLVLVLHVKGKQFFFGGDIDQEKEAEISKAFPDLDVDVMQANHHGSKYSNSFSFLSCVSPEFVVISYGNNAYGHPAPSAVARFLQVGATVFETKENGTITFRISENGNMTYKTSR